MMNRILNLYYIEKETGKKLRDKVEIEINDLSSGEYTIETPRFEVGGKYYYPIYAVNNGAVSSERINGSDGYRKIKYGGIAGNTETENNWILYFSEKDPSVDDAKKIPLKSKMNTNTENVRIGVSGTVYEVEKYIETSDTVLFDSVQISTGSMSESFYTYGSTFSPSCSITMTPNSEIAAGKYIRIEFTIDGVWQLFGVFYINTPPNMTSEQMTVNGSGVIDSILSKIKPIDISDSSELGKLMNVITIPYIIEMVKKKTGIEIVFDFEDKLKAYNYEDTWYKYSAYVSPCEIIEITDDSADSIMKHYYTLKSTINKSIREILSIFAITFHSNVIERNGKIHITHNSISDYENDIELFDEGDYSEEPETKLNAYYCPNEIKVKCTQMKFNIWDGISEDNGGGVPVYMDNAEKNVTIMDKPYNGKEKVVNYPLEISEESLWCEATVIRPQYWGEQTWARYPIREYAQTIGVVEPFIYYPIDVEFLGFNPYIYAGSAIKIETNGVIKNIYVGNVTISWDGMMSMQVSTPCDIEVSGNNSGPTSSYGGPSSSAGIGSSASVMSSIMTGQIFKYGAIENSKIKDSTITGSKFVDGTITGSKIADSTITGSLIANNTISGNKISENTITGNLIENNTLTGNLIKDGTITNNLIKDSTLTGAKISDATIGFEKVDESFIAKLTADSAYIKDLTAKVASISSLTADDAIIKNIQSVAISADYIRAITADIGYLKADEADLKYADITFGNIDTANIDKGNIAILFNKIGLIDRATIVDGHITGFLDAVEVNANKITAGTLVAERLLLKGSEDGLLFALNNIGELVSQNVDTLDGGILTERTITADKLVVNSITANEIDASKTFTNELIAKTIASSSGEFINLDASQITAGVIDSSRIDTNEIFVAYSKNYATVREDDPDTMFGSKGNIYNEVGSPTIIDGMIRNKNSAVDYIVPMCPLTKNDFSGGETIKVRANIQYITTSSVASRAFVFFTDNDGYTYVESKIYSEKEFVPSGTEVTPISYEIRIPKKIARKYEKYVIGISADKGNVVKPLLAISKCDARNVIYGGIETGEKSTSTFGNVFVQDTIDALNVRTGYIGDEKGIVTAMGTWDFSERIKTEDYVQANKFYGDLQGTFGTLNNFQYFRGACGYGWNSHGWGFNVDEWIYPGSYGVSSGCTPLPTSSPWGTLVVFNGTNDENRVLQLYNDWNMHGSVFFRTKNVTWSEWDEFATVSGKVKNAENLVNSDTRNDNRLPSWYQEYYPRRTITEFKNCAAINIQEGGQFCVLETTVPWSDESGGYPFQVAKCNSGNEYKRIGDNSSTWGEWRKVVDKRFNGDIVIARALSLNQMTLAGYYDGYTSGIVQRIENYKAFAITPMSSGSRDVVYMSSYFENWEIEGNTKIFAFYKNTVEHTKTFTPQVNVLYVKTDIY